MSLLNCNLRFDLNSASALASFFSQKRLSLYQIFHLSICGCLNLLIMATSPTTVLADKQCPCYAPVVNFPNIQTFESQSSCALDGLHCASLSCSISGSWQNVSSDDIDWIIAQGKSATTNTGPASDASGSYSGKYAYLESSCPDIGHPSKEAILYSSCFNFSNIEAPELSFDYHMFGAEMGALSVEISTDSCLSWSEIDRLEGPQQASSNEAWRNRKVNMIPYSRLSNVRVRFRGLTGSNQLSDLAIDNIQMAQASCCDVALKEILSPGNSCSLSLAQPVSIRLENRGFNPQSDFDVSYQIDGDVVVTETFSGILPGGSSLDYTFNTKADLSSPGEHTILAFVTLSGDSDNTNDSLEKTVVHIPTITEFPYIQDFEAGKGGWLASGTNSSWAFGTPAKQNIRDAASGNYAWVTGGLSTGLYRNSESSQVVSPCFDFSALKYPTIAIKAWWDAETSWDGAVLQSSIDGGTTWQRVGNLGDSAAWYNNSSIVGLPGGQLIGWSGSSEDSSDNSSKGWLSATDVLSGLAGKSNVLLRFAFGSDPKVPGDGFAFDDISIAEGLSASMTDSIIYDANGDGRADAGDKIKYTATLRNQSARSISGVIFEDYPDAATSLRNGSVSTTQGNVTRGNGSGQTYLRVSVGTLAAAASVNIAFETTVNPPTAGASTQICTQGSVISNSFSNFLTDDPALSGSFDRTCTSSYPDSDADGVPDAVDACPLDAHKIVAGVCGCGNLETDSDADGVPNCIDTCPNDPHKSNPGACGCGNAETDTDRDGFADCIDACPTDANKQAAGRCGCGVADTDSDNDGTPNCSDNCPNDAAKTQPGVCGCGIADTDSDNDGSANCLDACPSDPAKTTPGVCGCNISDVDSDHDGNADCNDSCANDSLKETPGICGCGVADTDSDNDGTPNCLDECPNDSAKTQPGSCGCGLADADTDKDGMPDCHDACPNDPSKSTLGICGCGVSDSDSDHDGTADCLDQCADNPLKITAGVCGCAVADTDIDNDGTPDCIDACPNNSIKSQPGVCGCNVADSDSDADATADCIDQCPHDPNKISAGQCGCGIADTDSDDDGIPNCLDLCPADPDKTTPNQCGCGEIDTDSDSDGVADCNDLCPQDPAKTEAGVCGCGLEDVDSDSDGTLDCRDACPQDALKIEKGVCGCGVRDIDTDADKVLDCQDLCPLDPNKQAPGICGCGITDSDSDGDGVADCVDLCPADPNKGVPGVCGCGLLDTDTDKDGFFDCQDACPLNAAKVLPGICGCSQADVDANKNGIFDCQIQPEFKKQLLDLQNRFKRFTFSKGKASSQVARDIDKRIIALQKFAKANVVKMARGVRTSSELSNARKYAQRAASAKKLSTFNTQKKLASKAITKLQKGLLT